MLFDATKTLNDIRNNAINTLDLHQERLAQARDYQSTAILEDAGSVYALTVLPDGCIVSSSDNNNLWLLWFSPTLRIWDANRQRCIAAFEESNRAVHALAILPDGRIVSGSSDRLRIWDANTRQSIATLNGHTNAVIALAVLPDGCIVSGSKDKTLRIWDANTQQCLATLKGHTNAVIALAVLPDGRIVSGSKDKTLRIWDANTQQCLATLKGHTNAVIALAVLPDGRIISGSDDNTLRIWDANTQQSLYSLNGHTDAVYALAVLSDGRIVSGSTDSTLRIWDANTQQCIATLNGHTDAVNALAVLPDGRIVSGSDDATLRIWDGDIPILSLIQFQNIIAALKLNNSVTSLSFAYSNLNDSHMQAIADMLTANTSIISLDLSHNQITHRGIASLLNAVHNNSMSIHIVNLDGNDLGTENEPYRNLINAYLASKKNERQLQQAVNDIDTQVNALTVAEQASQAANRTLEAEKQAAIDDKQRAADNLQASQTANKVLEAEKQAAIDDKQRVADDLQASQAANKVLEAEKQALEIQVYTLTEQAQQAENLAQQVQKLGAEEKRLQSELRDLKQDFEKLTAAYNKLLPKIDANELTIESTLGKGSYGLVQKAKWKGEIVAVKRLNVAMPGDEVERFKREARILASLHSPTIVTIHGVNFADNFIVMEYCEKGSLRDRLNRKIAKHKGFALPKIKNIALQIAKGIHYLHRFNILHLDLKPENILISGDKQHKLADFGAALTQEEATATFANMKGTLQYISPEILDKGKAGFQKEADIYSYGIVLWELASIKLPYKNENLLPDNTFASLTNFYNHVAKQHNRPTPVPEALTALQTGEGQPLAGLIKLCWDKEPKTRPAAYQIVQQLEQPEAIVPTVSPAQPISTAARLGSINSMPE